MKQISIIEAEARAREYLGNILTDSFNTGRVWGKVTGGLFMLFALISGCEAANSVDQSIPAPPLTAHTRPCPAQQALQRWRGSGEERGAVVGSGRSRKHVGAAGRHRHLGAPITTDAVRRPPGRFSAVSYCPLGVAIPV